MYIVRELHLISLHSEQFYWLGQFMSSSTWQLVTKRCYLRLVGHVPQTGRPQTGPLQSYYTDFQLLLFSLSRPTTWTCFSIIPRMLALSPGSSHSCLVTVIDNIDFKLHVNPIKYFCLTPIILIICNKKIWSCYTIIVL